MRDHWIHGSPTRSAVCFPETVAAKIARTVASLDVDRFDLEYSSGRPPHQLLMRNIKLHGSQVVPRVRELLGEEAELLAG
jgi:hypothetical protein